MLIADSWGSLRPYNSAASCGEAGASSDGPRPLTYPLYTVATPFAANATSVAYTSSTRTASAVALTRNLR